MVCYLRYARVLSSHLYVRTWCSISYVGAASCARNDIPPASGHKAEKLKAIETAVDRKSWKLLPVVPIISCRRSADGALEIPLGL